MATDTSMETDARATTRRYNVDAARRSAQARPRQIPQRNGAELARWLGWLSVGLGLAEVAAPRAVSRFIGVANHHSLLSLLGLRELANGVAILQQPSKAARLSGRIGGDVIDLSLLGAALRSPNSDPKRLLAAVGMVTAVTAIDTYCRRQLQQSSSEQAWTPEPGIDVTKCVTINKSAAELYRFWRDFRNLPRFMRHLESVEVTGERSSRWVAKAPAGTTVEWEAEIVEDQPDELIAWRSLPGADVDNYGSISFEPARAGRGTVVRVELRYRPPGGTVGSWVAKLFGEEPQQQIDDDLRRFKQLLETGEVATTEGQTSGRRKAA